MKRLVKGLGSSRKGARQGFATALSQVLEEFSDAPFENVFDLMNEHLTVKKNSKSQVSSCYFILRIFTILWDTYQYFDALECDS